MSKDKDEKLEEVLRLLRKLVSKRKTSYRTRAIYRPISKSLGGYRSRLSSYPTAQNLRYRPEPRYSSKHEKAPSYVIRSRSEPTAYYPKERLVYDPEVKRLLQKIEKHLSSEPDAEEISKLLENNPELYERISQTLLEKMGSDSYEQTEAEAEQREIENGEETEVEADQDQVQESFLKDEIEDEAEKVSSEILEENLSEAEPPENVEGPSIKTSEPSTEAIEQLEAQDLSELEAELYEEPIETLEPEVEELEPEPVLETYEDVKAEAAMLREEMDDPVFWQRLEDEAIEKRFRKQQPRPEPEMDEYGY